MRKKRNPHATITSLEAERAMYIDFEGFSGKTPALLGILIQGQLEQIVLDEELRPVAEATGLRVSSLKDEVERLLKRCSSENRFIVAFSQHERKVISDFAELDISDRYRDARMIARRWQNRVYPDKQPKVKSLKEYLDLIQYRRPPHLGNRKSTKRLKGIRDMIRVRKTYDSLTPVKKAHWTNLLSHNGIDCKGMHALIVLAAADPKAN